MKTSIFIAIVFAVLLFPFSQISSQQNIWEPVGNRLEGKNFTALAVDQNDNLYVGIRNGFYKSTNNGDEWINIYNGLDGYDIFSIVFNNSGEIFIGTSNGGGIFKSTNEGEKWIHLNDSLINFSIRKLEINNNDYLFAFIDSRGMYRSMDNGNSWEEVNNGLTIIIFNSMFISKLGPTKNFIFIGVGSISDGRGVFRTTDNGDNWEPMNLDLSWDFAMTFTTNSLGEVYVGTQSQWHNGHGGILKSADGGYNWLWAGFTAQISELILDRNEFIYVSATGISRTTDLGANWENFSSGLPFGGGKFLNCNSKGILFTVNSNGGIYRTTGTTTDVKEYYNNFPKEFNLSQNYPNPFNPTTTITYQVPEISFVTLKIYDVLGNEIATLVNEEKPAGSYEVEFDASSLSSGIYFYKLQSGSFIQTKKMILLK